jgi:hypothetical protein
MSTFSPLPDYDKFHEFEARLIASEPVDYVANLRLADAMYEHARKLGVFPGPDPLEGIEVNIRMSKVFRSVHRTP